MRSKLNKELKKARKKTGFTQVQVADKAQITQRNYQRIENEGQFPRSNTAILIAAALNSSVEDLFGGATSDRGVETDSNPNT